jgi:hypothetical protein
MSFKIDAQPIQPVRRGSINFFLAENVSDNASSSNALSTTSNASPPVRSSCPTPSTRAASPPMLPSRHPEFSSEKYDCDDGEAMITKDTTFFKAPQPAFWDYYEKKVQKKEKTEPKKKKAKNAKTRQRAYQKARILVQNFDPLSPTSIGEIPKCLRIQLVHLEALLATGSEQQSDEHGLFEDSGYLLVALEEYTPPGNTYEEVVRYSRTPAGTRTYQNSVVAISA